MSDAASQRTPPRSRRVLPPRDQDTSTFTRIRSANEDLSVEQVPVRFTRVRPGESLV